MGYFADNTVEIEVNGVKYRVFSLEAEAVKEALIRESKNPKQDSKPKPSPN